MKGLMILLAFLFTFVIVASDTPKLPTNLKGQIQFQEVVQVPDTPAPELYSRAQLWMAKTFVSGKDVTQLNDKENGTVLLKGNTMVHFGMGYTRIGFTLLLEIKDGRYRYTLSDFKVLSRGDMPWNNDLSEFLKSDGSPKMGFKKFPQGFMDEFNGILASLKVAMSTKMGSNF